MLEEFFSGKISTAAACFSVELPFDHSLCGNSGVVCANDPERLIAAHALIADQDVFERIDKGMAHVQNTCDVRGGDDDAIGRLLRRGVGFEKAPFFPKGRPLFFDELRLVSFR